MSSCNECYNLKYYNAFDVAQMCATWIKMGHDVIYLVYVTNPQMFVGWLHAHVRQALHTINTTVYCDFDILCISIG